MTDHINIFDFGSPVSGNITPLVRAAMASQPGPYRKSIYIPAGNWNITEPINYNGANEYGWTFIGDHSGTRIIGNFADFLFKRDEPAGVPYGPYIFDGLWLRNINTAGGCIQAARGTNFHIRDCSIMAFGIGIKTYDAFTVKIESTKFSSYGYHNSIGLMTGGHITVDACDFQGWTHGIRAWGAGHIIRGNRIEVCKTGLMLGQNAEGQRWMASRGAITGNSFEACDTAIYADHCGTFDISGNGAQGSVSAPAGVSEYGIRTTYCTAVQFAANSFVSQFSKAAWKADAPYQSCVLQSNDCSNTRPGGVVWDIDEAHVNTIIQACNNLVAAGQIT